jgi:hypothetical protein
MAGNPGPLIGREYALRPAMSVAGLVVAICGALCAEQRTGDVMIVEHPERLVVFSKYQQRLTPDEYRRLPPFAPMVLQREHDHLGDGFTPCAAVEIGREPYYILRNEGGGFSARGEPGKTEIFRNVPLLSDTVVLLRGRALRLRPAGDREEVLLPPGTRVVRIFEHESGTYVRLSSPGGRFGWLSLPGSARSSQWREVETASPAGISSGDLLLRVRPVVDGANESLRRIYAALSPETGKGQTPPSFRLSLSHGEIRCILEPAALSGSFSGSMRALLAGLERVLGGTGLHPEISDGAIFIPLQ